MPVVSTRACMLLQARTWRTCHIDSTAQTSSNAPVEQCCDRIQQLRQRHVWHDRRAVLTAAALAAASTAAVGQLDAHAPSSLVVAQGLIPGQRRGQTAHAQQVA
jgi:hypothetical protein